MRMRKLLVLAAMAAAGSAQAQQPAAPACSGPAYRQLDFWVGDWELEFDAGKGQVGHASNHVTRGEFGDCVIAEHFAQPDIAYAGGSWSTYDGQLGLWRQTWVDNQGSVFVLTGGPVAGQPYAFELKTSEARGPDKAIKRMIWQDVSADALTWRWQTQGPDGAWKDLWVLKYKRRQQ
jgi:hypothetical protein